MKIEIEIDESKYGLLCKKEEAETVKKNLCHLYGIIWSEARYDPYNEHTQKFADRMLPLISDLNKILKFKA